VPTLPAQHVLLKNANFPVLVHLQLQLSSFTESTKGAIIMKSRSETQMYIVKIAALNEMLKLIKELKSGYTAKVNLFSFTGNRLHTVADKLHTCCQYFEMHLPTHVEYVSGSTTGRFLLVTFSYFLV
jgi:hypothetical protein